MKSDIEIIEYRNFSKNMQDEVINDFVSQCMNIFIGRPLKRRDDVLNIKEYYINNGGNFWIAMDKGKNEIVGTIAIEMKEDKGILKRFYVKKEYQNMGLGSQLYDCLEKYVLEHTKVRTIYLACGKILEKAHRFYLKHGWKQINDLEIGMHTAEDDDYFKKVL